MTSPTADDAPGTTVSRPAAPTPAHVAVPAAWVTVINPDDSMGPPLHEGLSDDAHQYLVPGTYQVYRSEDPTGAYRLVIGQEGSLLFEDRSEPRPSPTPADAGPVFFTAPQSLYDSYTTTEDGTEFDSMRTRRVFQAIGLAPGGQQLVASVRTAVLAVNDAQRAWGEEGYSTRWDYGVGADGRLWVEYRQHDAADPRTVRIDAAEDRTILLPARVFAPRKVAVGRDPADYVELRANSIDTVIDTRGQAIPADQFFVSVPNAPGPSAAYANGDEHGTYKPLVGNDRYTLVEDISQPRPMSPRRDLIFNPDQAGADGSDGLEPVPGMDDALAVAVVERIELSGAQLVLGPEVPRQAAANVPTATGADIPADSTDRPPGHLDGPADSPPASQPGDIRVSVIGNLAADPKFGYSEDGHPCLQLIVVSAEGSGGPDETRTAAPKQRTEVVVSGDAAVLLANQAPALTKGDRVEVTGRHRLETLERPDGSPGAALMVDAIAVRRPKVAAGAAQQDVQAWRRSADAIVFHNAEHTIVTGVARGDKQLQQALMEQGFMWSAPGQAWHLPASTPQHERRLRLGGVSAALATQGRTLPVTTTEMVLGTSGHHPIAALSAAPPPPACTPSVTRSL